MNHEKIETALTGLMKEQAIPLNSRLLVTFSEERIRYQTVSGKEFFREVYMQQPKVD